MTTDSGIHPGVSSGDQPGDEPADGPRTPAPPPAPPADADPATSFAQQQATRWLAPGLLLRSAGEVVVSGLLGEYNDKRELMAALDADEPLDLRLDPSDPEGGPKEHQEAWIDYVSDTGDGFAATYAVASVLAQETLTVAPEGGEPVLTPRGELLVMGGDECYPSAHVQVYEDRLIGPYRAALREVLPKERAPKLLAIPGNHDWYDGLTAFMRTFCQRRWIGGWHTQQSRSYFVVKLPGRWWLWGIDIQFDTYIDDEQRRYFERAAADLEEGDAVILCSAKPSWVSTAEDDLEAYATLDFVDRTLIRSKGARLRVCISGDRHHYARYEAADGGQRITAGGGGAYLTPTHHLKPRIPVPPPGSVARGKSESVEFVQRSIYPDADTSRRLGRGVVRLPWETRSFTGLMGGVQALLTLAMLWAVGGEQLSLPRRLSGTAEALEQATPGRLAVALADSLPNLALALLVVGSAIAFTKKPGARSGLVAGILHGLLHLALAVFLTWAVAWLVSPLPGVLVPVLLVLLVFVLGGVLATELVAVYLLVADRFGLNSNELYAAQAIPDHKNFLRLHVDREGDLTIHPVGLRDVPRAWDPHEGPPADRPRFDPRGGPLESFLIEPPVRVSPDPVGSTAPAAAKPRNRA